MCRPTQNSGWYRQGGWAIRQDHRGLQRPLKSGETRMRQRRHRQLAFNDYTLMSFELALYPVCRLSAIIGQRQQSHDLVGAAGGFSNFSRDEIDGLSDRVLV